MRTRATRVRVRHASHRFWDAGFHGFHGRASSACGIAARTSVHCTDAGSPLGSAADEEAVPEELEELEELEALEALEGGACSFACRARVSHRLASRRTHLGRLLFRW